MSQKQGLIEITAIEQSADSATAVREKALIQLKGSEEMEWVEEYIEDDNWDDE